MTEIAFFAEDFAHESFLNAILQRFCKDYGTSVKIHQRSSSRGGSRFITEMKQYLRDIRRGTEPRPDHLIIITDSNCGSVSKKTRQILDGIPPDMKDICILAIPEPHVERWMLVDSAAFKKVFGRGCAAPDKKCDRGRYKGLLSQEIMESGTTPAIGGMEWAVEVVEGMDLDRIEDKSLRRFIKDLHRVFQNISR
jgi:hypothetical protein